MASFDDISAAIEVASAAAAVEAAEVQLVLAAQAAEIQSFKDQIAALASTSSITAEQADALLVSANALSTTVSGIFVPAVA